jgi:DNA-directed RNA polymerase subunit K/omega
LQGGARSYLPTTSRKPTVSAMEEVRRGLVKYGSRGKEIEAETNA